MGMDAGGVFRLDEERRQLVLVGHFNISEQLLAISTHLPLESSIISEVVHTKRPVSCLTVDYPPGRLRQALLDGGWMTVVSIPLLFQDNVLGAMNIVSHQQVHLSPEQLAVPASIGQQIGVVWITPVSTSRLWNMRARWKLPIKLPKARTAAEAANAAKSDFLANVSHELRTPLVSIFGFARLVKKRLDDKIFPQLTSADQKPNRVVEQIDDNLEIILSESQRLTSLINSLLDLEKIESR